MRAASVPGGSWPSRPCPLSRSALPRRAEDIYGPRPWKIYGEGLTETVEGHLSEQRNKQMGPEDIRFTTQGGTLYATALGLAEQEWTIESLRAGSEYLEGRAVSVVHLLGYEGDLDWSQRQDALAIRRPGGDPGKHAFVFEVTLD